MLLKQSKMKKNEQKSGFIETLLGTLGVSLLGNMLAGKAIMRVGGEKLEQARIFNAVSSFLYFWNIKILSKWT